MIAAPLPTDPDLPPLDLRAAEILAAFLAPGVSVRKLLQERGLSITELLNWHRRPDVQAHLQAFFALLEDAAHATALQVRPAAINALGDLALTVADPVERRRAALPALRAFGPVRHRRARGSTVPRLRARSGSPTARHLPLSPSGGDVGSATERASSPSSPPTLDTHQTTAPAPHPEPASTALSSAPGRGGGGDVRRSLTEGAFSSTPPPPDRPSTHTSASHPTPATQLHRPVTRSLKRRPLTTARAFHLPASRSPRPYDITDDSSVHEPPSPAAPDPAARPPPALSL